MREVTISLSSLCGDPSGRTAFPTFWGWGAGGRLWVYFLIFVSVFFFFFLHLAHAGQWSPASLVPLSGSHALAQGSLLGAYMV